MSRPTLAALALIAVGCSSVADPAIPVAEPRGSAVEAHAAGRSDVVWSAADRGLRLGVSAEGSEVTVVLENASDAPIDVYGDASFFYLQVDGATIGLGKGGPVSLSAGETRARLAPGERVTHEIDLAGREEVGSGPRRVTAGYASMTRLASSQWSGALSAGPVEASLTPAR